jgi:aerotaxis receptor
LGRGNRGAVKEAGQVIGYMSVRSAPTREQVAAATELYRKFRAGEQGALTLRDRRAVRTGLTARLPSLRSLPWGAAWDWR